MKKIYFILLIIMILGAFLRFYKLSDFPIQLNHDEVTQLYDAISIAQTGRDIYGNFLPVIFYSVGDFKSPFYTYITSVFYMVFGSGELTVRLPAALFGLAMIPAVYLFSLKLFKSNIVALTAAFLTSIAPFELFFSRKSFENGAGIFLMLLGFASLFVYVEKQDKVRWLYFASFSLGFALYTYFSHAIIIPFLVLVFIVIFRKNFLDNFGKSLIPFLIFLIFLLPLILLTFTNPDVRNRSRAVFIIQDVNLGREIGYENEVKAIFDFSFNRYLEQFNPIYLFGNGLDFTNQGPLGMGPLLFIQLPFLIAGLIYLLRLTDFTKQKNFILAWILLGMLPSGLTFEPHSPHRSIMVFTMMNIISAAGLYFFFKKVHNLKIMTVLAIVFMINFVYFLHMYFVNFPFEKSANLHYPFKQVALFAWSRYDDFDQIIFDPLYGESAPVIGTAAHYYLAYYGGYSPIKFQKEYRLGNKEREVIFDKFSIREVFWPADRDLKNTLVIASPWSVPENDIADKSKIIKRFHFYNGKLAFYAIKL